jgi:hypothetical protein
MPRIEIAAAEREATGEPIVIVFHGQDFACSEGVNEFALMKMAGAEADGEMAVMGAFYRFLQTVLIPADWDRFEKVCMADRVGFAELRNLIEGVAEAMTGRPTPRPSASPPGPPPTTARSRVVSLSPATPRPA